MAGSSGVGAASVAEGWRRLALFSQEGARHLPRAIEAFRDAERAQRAAGGGEDLVNTLVGLSLALRLTRELADGRRALVLAQEVVNIVRRSRGDADALPYRAALEAAYRDLAEIERPEAAVVAAEEGVEACDRTLALAKRLRRPDSVPASQATKAALLNRRAALGDPSDASRRRRDAFRLFGTAVEAWPAHDAEGRATVLCDFSEALAGGRDPARAARLAREAAEVLRATPNRYLSARALRAEARAALAADSPDALDLIAAAAAEYRALGCEWDARQVEALV